MMKARKNTIIVGLVSSASVLAVGVVLFSPGLRWVGRKQVTVVVQVVDSETGNAVQGARIRISDGKCGVEGNDTISDEEGLGSVVGTFMAFGSDDLLRKNEFVSFVGVVIHVTAPGYTPVKKDLVDYRGLAVPFDALPLSAVRIPISPVEEPSL